MPVLDSMLEPILHPSIIANTVCKARPSRCRNEGNTLPGDSSRHHILLFGAPPKAALAPDAESITGVGTEIVGSEDTSGCSVRGDSSVLYAPDARGLLLLLPFGRHAAAAQHDWHEGWEISRFTPISTFEGAHSPCPCGKVYASVDANGETLESTYQESLCQERHVLSWGSWFPGLQAVFLRTPVPTPSGMQAALRFLALSLWPYHQVPRLHTI